MKSVSRFASGIAVLVMVGLALGGLSASLRAAEEGAEVTSDMALPTDEAAIAIGKAKFGEKCGGFCHGSGGKGARAPCLICGKFKRGAKDSQLVANITNGVPGTAMGAFGDALTKDEIIDLVAYLRAEQKKKEAEAQ